MTNLHGQIDHIDYEYPEDEQFFIALLGKDELNPDIFDFRDSKLKRREFEKVREHLKGQMLAAGRTTCELRLLYTCIDNDLVLDHIIPLSSNELNKRIRKLPPPRGKKIKRQSFGSNHPSNLLVACAKCNGYKKHRFIRREREKWVIVDKNDPVWDINATSS